MGVIASYHISRHGKTDRRTTLLRAGGVCFLGAVLSWSVFALELAGGRNSVLLVLCAITGPGATMLLWLVLVTIESACCRDCCVIGAVLAAFCMYLVHWSRLTSRDNLFYRLRATCV